jgi:hypothetical protein
MRAFAAAKQKRCKWNVLAIVTLAACDPTPLNPGVEVFRVNQNRWRGNGITSYEHVVRRTCSQGTPEMHVRVINNSVVAVTRASDGTALPQSEWRHYPNVEGVFALMEEHLRKQNARLSVSYDAEFNFPICTVAAYSYRLTPEFEFFIGNFRRLP